MLKCRKCKVGNIRIVSEIIDHYAIVHCQNRECAVLYERRLTGAFLSGGSPEGPVGGERKVQKADQTRSLPLRRRSTRR